MGLLMAPHAMTSRAASGNGQVLPPLDIALLDGSVIPHQTLQGKVVVYLFWATWCPPCRSEMPEFNEMDKDLKQSKEAVLLAINMTDGMRDTKDKVAKFLKQEGYGMKVLLDTESRAANIFAIRGIPTTVVIDGKGVLRGQIVGATTKDSVMKIVKGIK